VQCRQAPIAARNRGEVRQVMMSLVVCPGRNTGIELGKKADITSALNHNAQPAKTDVTNVVFMTNCPPL
jgi:hypothetical protein